MALGPVLGLVTKSGNALSAETPAGIVKGAGKDAFMASVNANPAARTFLYDEVVRKGLANGIGDDVEAALDPEGAAAEISIEAMIEDEAAAA